MDSGGNVYVADSGNYTIRKITGAGVVSTVAGIGHLTSAGSADGIGTADRFVGTTSLAADPSGNVSCRQL